MYHHSKSVIGQFFDWHESPFKWQTRNTTNRIRRLSHDNNIFEPPPNKPQKVHNPQPEIILLPTRAQNSHDEKVIRVNPIKFPARYLEPSRNHIPNGFIPLPDTPEKSKVPMTNFIPSGKKLTRTPPPNPRLRKSISADNLISETTKLLSENEAWNQRKINSQKKAPNHFESPLINSPYTGEQSLSRRGSKEKNEINIATLKVPKNPAILENDLQSTVPAAIRLPSVYKPSLASNEQRRQSIKSSSSNMPIPAPKSISRSLESSKIPLPIKSREIAIQTGGIMTVTQKSKNNFIPTGNQLRRSPKTPLRRTATAPPITPKMNVDIEVHHDDDTISQVKYKSTSRISLHFTPEEHHKFEYLRKSSKKEREEIQAEKKKLTQLIRKISRASSKVNTGRHPMKAESLPKLEPVNKKIEKDSEPHQLQPIKTTSQGVLLVMVKN